jgi:hypothetical protein
VNRRLTAGAALLLLWWAPPASAHLVEVTTYVAVADSTDQAAVKEAIQSAVDAVLQDAIAFTPTLVVLTHAFVVGDRLYIRLVVADREGERTYRDLSGPSDAAPERKDSTLRL